MINGNLLSEQVTKTITDWSSQINKENLSNKTENSITFLTEVNKSSTDRSVFQYQNDLLQKEVANLRSQCISLQKVFADVQR